MRISPFIRPFFQPHPQAKTSPVRFGSDDPTPTPISREKIDFLSRMFIGRSGFDLLQWIENEGASKAATSKVSSPLVGRERMFKDIYAVEAYRQRFDAMLDEFESEGFLAATPETVSLTPHGVHVLSQMNIKKEAFTPLNQQLKRIHSELAQQQIKPAQAQVAHNSEELEIDEEFQEAVAEMARQRVESLEEHLRETSWKLSEAEIRSFREAIGGYEKQITDHTKALAKKTQASAQALQASEQQLIAFRQQAEETLTRISDALFEALNH